MMPFACAGARRPSCDRVAGTIVQPCCSRRSAILREPAVKSVQAAPTALPTDRSAPPACLCDCPGTSSRGPEERTG